MLKKSNIAFALCLIMLVACGPKNSRGVSTQAISPVDSTTEAEKNQKNADAVANAQAAADAKQAKLALADAEIAQISLGNYNGMDRAAAQRKLQELQQQRAEIAAELATTQSTVAVLQKKLDDEAEQASILRRTIEQVRASVAAKQKELDALQNQPRVNLATPPPLEPALTPAGNAGGLQAPPLPPLPAMPPARQAVTKAAPPAQPTARITVSGTTAPAGAATIQPQHFRQPPSGNSGTATTAAPAPQPVVAPQASNARITHPANSPGSGDDAQYIHNLGKIIPLVYCHADYVLQEKFILIFGHGNGEMVITCSQGVGNESFTALAKIKEIEAGFGWKDLTEEGSFYLYDIGIDNKAVFGASAMLKATGGYAGHGGSVSAGVNVALPPKAGFIVGHGEITRGAGFALTLNLMAWKPACGGSMPMLEAAGHDVKSIQQTPCQQ